MLISPEQHDIRRYFCQVYTKWCRQQPLDAMEKLLAGWMQEHPEYNAVLSQPQAAAGSVPLRTDAQTRVQPGDAVGLAVEPANAHWFDASSENRLA